jgi:acylaminoacyl-peptidase
LLVLIHGGPHGSGDVSLTFFKYLLLQAGYTILIPNFSGSIGFGKKHLEGALGKIGEYDA